MRASTSHSPRRSLADDVARALRADLRQVFREKTRDEARAEDLTQEAMARVIAGLHHFRGDASLRTWARRIALNLWRDEARTPASHAAVPAGDGDDLSVLAWLDAEDGEPGDAPGAARDRSTTRTCLLDTIDRLPPSERTAVLLHELGDVSLDDAARTLGCSVAAVKVRLHRGRHRLAALCRAECVEEVGTAGDRICAPRPRMAGGERADEP
jgi:RNA polymerase sigma-70 factor (ECF subfamily)